MTRRLLTLLGLLALLAACGGNAAAPAATTAPGSAPASAAAAGGTARTAVSTPASGSPSRATAATPGASGAGLPPVPGSTITAIAATAAAAGTPGTARPATPPPASGSPAPGGTPRALPSAPPVAFLPAPWQAGDRTIYTVTARDTGQQAGTATFTLGREFDADTLSALLTIGSTQDRFVLGWATATLAPATEIRSIVTAQGTVDIRAEFHDGGATIEVIGGSGTTVQRLNLPPQYYANDQLLVILRALPFKEGYQGALTLVPSLGDPATQRAVVTVTGQETVTTPLGPVRSWRVEAQFEGSATTQVLWYAVAAPNYLVKYDTGRYIYTATQRP